MYENILNILFSSNIIYIIFGTTIGLFAGVMPGLNAGTAVTIMLPLTFYMDVKIAMSFLVAIYISAMCGGGLLAVYFNIPGTPSSAVTAIDGYPMAQKGEYCRAVGLVIGASFFGGLISFIVLFFSISFLGELASKFGPMQLFFTALLGMICAVGVKSQHPYKGITSGLLGFLLGTIGYSPSGIPRATFNIVELFDGIPFLPLLIGMLAMSEVFVLVDKEYVLREREAKKSSFKEIIFGIYYVFKKPLFTFYSAIIGTIVGIIPGAGATLASFLSYTRAKETSKNSEEFGKGVPEGVIASEAANNASVGGGLTTSLLLGIPGTATCAILLGALMIHGIPVGTTLVVRHKDIIYSIISSLFIANMVMLVIAIFVAKYLNTVVLLPTKYLVPIITIFCCLGSYMTRFSVIDVWIMFFFGLLGHIMRINNYPPLPLVVAAVVAPIADASLIRSIQIHQNRIFIAIISNPINLILIGLNILMLLYTFRSMFNIQKR